MTWFFLSTESLCHGLEEVPHIPSRARIEKVARALIEKGLGWEVFSTWWYPKYKVRLPYSTWYWPRPKSPPHWQVDEKKAIALNRYLTNGMDSRDGQHVGILLTSLDFTRIYCLSPPEQGVKRSARAILKEVLDKIVRLRADQVFQDGNHRTAILLLYEMLANHKILLQAKPLTLYIMLSSRCWYSDQGKGPRQRVVEVMYQHCKSRLKFLDAVPSLEERPALFANAVKSLMYENSLINQIAELWVKTEARHYAPERRVLGRYLKKLDRGLYEQFRRLCVEGAYEAAPKSYYSTIRALGTGTSSSTKSSSYGLEIKGSDSLADNLKPEASEDPFEGLPEMTEEEEEAYQESLRRNGHYD